MDKSLKKFFTKLVETPSPSGYEQKAQQVYRDFVAEYCDEVKTDVHGNVIAHKKGDGKVKIMISGHVDEIGFMVNYIDNDGYLYVKPIGGIDTSLLPGLRVNVYGKDDKIVRGVFGRIPIHIMSPENKGKHPKIHELWIDIGAKDKKDAEKKVAIGNIVTFSPGLETLNKDVITTKATDNKVGVFVAAVILKHLADEKTSAHVYSVSSVQEEIGIRGARTSAFSVDPDVGIAIDVTVASDHPGTDKKSLGEISVGKGPVVVVGPNINPKVHELLHQAAENKKIKVQTEVASRATGTDANAIQVSRGGVATGLISIANRYMHSPNEVISLNDLYDATVLLAEFIKLINDSTDFTP